MADSSAARFEQARGLVGSGGVMQSSFTSVPPSTSATAPLAFPAAATPAPAPVAAPPSTLPAISPSPPAYPFAGPMPSPGPFALPTMPGQMSPYDFNPSSLSSYSTPQLPTLPPPPPSPPALHPPGWSKTKRIVVSLLAFGILILFVFWMTRPKSTPASGSGSTAGSPSPPPSLPQSLEATVHLDTKSPIEIRSTELTAGTDAIKTQLQALHDAIADLQAGQQLIEDSLGIENHKKPPTPSPSPKKSPVPPVPPSPIAPPGKSNGPKARADPAPYTYGNAVNFAHL